MEGIICKECGSTPCNPNCIEEGLSSTEGAVLQRLVTLDSGETVRLHDAAITIANMFQNWIDRSPSSAKIMPTEYPDKQTVKNWISVLREI